MRMWMIDPKKMCNKHLFGEVSFVDLRANLNELSFRCKNCKEKIQNNV